MKQCKLLLVAFFIKNAKNSIKETTFCVNTNRNHTLSFLKNLAKVMQMQTLILILFKNKNSPPGLHHCSSPFELRNEWKEKPGDGRLPRSKLWRENKPFESSFLSGSEMPGVAPSQQAQPTELLLGITLTKRKN